MDYSFQGMNQTNHVDNPPTLPTWIPIQWRTVFTRDPEVAAVPIATRYTKDAP
jgi:hypothetical protein